MSVQPASPRLGQYSSNSAANPEKRAQAGRGQLLDLAVPFEEILQENLHGGDAGCDGGLGRTLGLRFGDTAPKHSESRNDLAFDTLIDNCEEERPDIGGGLEVVAAVADAAVDLHQVP